MKISNFKLGFTLFELLLSISIMGILIGVIIFLVDPGFQFKKARDSQRKSDLRTIQSALELYRSDKGSYPDQDPLTSNNLPANCNSGVSFGNSNCSTIYLQRIPTDPKGGNYMYYKSSNIYCLRTCLENTNDTQKDPSNDNVPGCTFTYSATCVSSGKWSYTLQNP